MEKYKNWSDVRIVRRHETLAKRTSNLVALICDNGFGSYTPNQMRLTMTTNKMFNKYLLLVDEMSDLRSEANLRYGPGLITMRQLTYRRTL